MARKKKSWLKRFVVVAVLGLAAYGGWVLYDHHQDTVASAANKVVDKTKAVGKALSE